MFLSKGNEKLESFIGLNSNFKGDITTKGTLRVDGNLEGNIDSDWLVVGETGAIKGNVTSRGIIVGGLLEGNSKVAESVEIKQKGCIKGDIITAKLIVAEGGKLDGRSEMSQKEDVKVIEFVQAKQ